MVFQSDFCWPLLLLDISLVVQVITVTQDFHKFAQEHPNVVDTSFLPGPGLPIIITIPHLVSRSLTPVKTQLHIWILPVLYIWVIRVTHLGTLNCRKTSPSQFHVTCSCLRFPTQLHILVFPVPFDHRTWNLPWLLSSGAGNLKFWNWKLKPGTVNLDLVTRTLILDLETWILILSLETRAKILDSGIWNLKYRIWETWK